MASNRSPDVRYNGSGYADRTASDAICKADRDLLRLRRQQLMNRLRSVGKGTWLPYMRRCGFDRNR